MSNDEWDEAVRETHRALGEFVVAFSLLTRELRERIVTLVGQAPAGPAAQLRIVLGEAPAMQLCSGFFGVLRASEGLDATELTVVNRLERVVAELIQERNDLLHGDWFVGYAAEGAQVPEDPSLLRIKPSRKSATASQDAYPTTVLDELIARTHRARIQVGEMGWVMVPGSMFPGYGLGDLFEIVDGQVQRRTDTDAPMWKYPIGRDRTITSP